MLERRAKKASSLDRQTGYIPEMPDDQILRRLLALNLERAVA